MNVVIDINKRKEYLKNWRNRSRRYLMLKGAQDRARRKQIIFDLKLEDIPSIPEVCPILKIPLKVNVGVSRWNDNSPSLDRIINSKGYVKDNIRIISNRANRLRMDASMEELEKIVLDARLHRH